MSPTWRAAKIAGGAAAAGLAFAIKHAPRRPPRTPGADEAAMPHDDPTSHADQRRDAGPVSGAQISLLYQTGSEFPDVAAELHQWLSPQAMLEQARWVAGGGGFGAVARHTPGRLADAIRERAPDHHRVARIRLAAPDRYRIDYISGEARSAPKTTACDGQRRWRV